MSIHVRTMFEIVDGLSDRPQSDWYTISSPMSLPLRWANKFIIWAAHQKTCIREPVSGFALPIAMPPNAKK